LQVAQRGFVELAAIALPSDLPIPLKAEPLERVQDSRRRSRNLSRPVEILDAQQPAAAMGARIQITGRRRI
jgi:hypothetical protein